MSRQREQGLEACVRARELEEDDRRTELRQAEEQLEAFRRALARLTAQVEYSEQRLGELLAQGELAQLGLVRPELEAALRARTQLLGQQPALERAVEQRRVALAGARAAKRAVELAWERVRAERLAERARAEARRADDMTSTRAARVALEGRGGEAA